MKEALFLNPVFQDRIWGGTQLHDYFGYNIPSDKTGEDWAISAHPNGPSTVKNGEFAGKRLLNYGPNIRNFLEIRKTQFSPY
ncbi:mannose-6-phosphate isomerase [Listeria fleischmannii subsp. fleischmannii LU2006-1]|nr:mannose-6-phosphate isomerase [Listeria fleischmannii subsp. fleischmannii LU2006-1]